MLESHIYGKGLRGIYSVAYACNTHSANSQIALRLLVDYTRGSPTMINVDLQDAVRFDVRTSCALTAI